MNVFKVEKERVEGILRCEDEKKWSQERTVWEKVILRQGKKGGTIIRVETTAESLFLSYSLIIFYRL